MLTAKAAREYVEAYFAKYGETVTINETVLVDDMSFDVLFTTNHETDGTFTVWEETSESGKPYLYGEW